MTRKDYERIASAISKAFYGLDDSRHRDSVRMVAMMVAEELAKENPRFQMERFMSACGLVSGVLDD